MALRWCRLLRKLSCSRPRTLPLQPLSARLVPDLPPGSLIAANVVEIEIILFVFGALLMLCLCTCRSQHGADCKVDGWYSCQLSRERNTAHLVSKARVAACKTEQMRSVQASRDFPSEAPQDSAPPIFPGRAVLGLSA